MNPAILAILKTALLPVIKLWIKSENFNRIKNQCYLWEQRKLTGAQKRQGILDNLEVIGLKMSETAALMAIQIVMLYMGKE